jgi:hypothetical protein
MRQTLLTFPGDSSLIARSIWSNCITAPDGEDDWTIGATNGLRKNAFRVSRSPHRPRPAPTSKGRLPCALYPSLRPPYPCRRGRTRISSSSQPSTTRWTRTGTRPTRYYAYLPSCYLTDSIHLAALAAAAATPDAPVAYHRRVRIATDRFPGTPKVSNDSRPTLIIPGPSLLFPFPRAHPPNHDRIDVYIEWNSLSHGTITSAIAIHVARERPYRPPISQIHPPVHSARRAPLVWREDGEVRFRTGSEGVRPCAGQGEEEEERKSEREKGRPQDVPAEELVGVLLKISQSRSLFLTNAAVCRRTTRVIRRADAGRWRSSCPRREGTPRFTSCTPAA